MATTLHVFRISGSVRRGTSVGLTLAIMLGLAAVATQTAQAQTYQVIHNFTGGGDGGIPESGFTMDRAGNIYGTATVGGNGPCPGGCGLVYELKHFGSGWILLPLYNFLGGSDGANPWGGVIFGPDGSLYGATVPPVLTKNSSVRAML